MTYLEQSGEKPHPRPLEFEPTQAELEEFARVFCDMAALKRDGKNVSDLLLNPDPKYLMKSLPLLAMGTLRLGIRDDMQGRGEKVLIPDMTIGAADPLDQILAPDSVLGQTMEHLQVVAGDDDPNAWPYLRSRHEVEARKATGELPLGFEPPYGVVAELVQNTFHDHEALVEKMSDLNETELVDSGAYKMQLIAYVREGKRGLAYAFIPDRLSDGLDVIVGYTSWIDYAIDHPEKMPVEARIKIQSLTYETTHHTQDRSSGPNKDELLGAISRLLQIPIRDKANADKKTWQNPRTKKL